MKLNKKLIIITTILNVLVLFFVIFYFTDTDIKKIYYYLQKAGILALLSVLLFIAIAFVVFILSWSILLRNSGYPVKFTTVASAVLIGWTVSFLTPSMYLGGEPIRAYIISEKNPQLPFRIALGSIFVHKFLEFTSFLFVIVLSTIWVLYKFSLSTSIQSMLILSIAVLLLIFSLILSMILLKKRAFSDTAKLFIRYKVLVNFIEKNIPKLEEIENYMIDAFYRDYKTTLLSTIFIFVFHTTLIVRPLAFFPFLGIFLSVSELLLVFLFTQILMAFQFTPGGLGIMEVGLVGAFKLLGISASSTLGFMIFYRIGNFLVVAISITLVLQLGLSKLVFSRKIFANNLAGISDLLCDIVMVRHSIKIR